MAKQKKKKNPQILLRKKLVDAVVTYAADEFESAQDYINLAYATNEQLVDQLISILDYYHNYFNSDKYFNNEKS